MIYQIHVGGDANFGYLIVDNNTGDAAVVDPSYGADIFIRLVNELSASLAGKVTVKYVIGTHSHTDHTKGMIVLRKKLGATTVRHKSARGPSEIRAEHKDVISLGQLELEILHTPGHTPDSICIYVSSNCIVQLEDSIITGDTLFVGKVGGTRTYNMARKQYDSLQGLEINTQTIIYPGHDFGIAPRSTTFFELHTNPFLYWNADAAKFSSSTEYCFDYFYALKENWAEYKAQKAIR